MSTTINRQLERLHPFFNLSLLHAAIGTYPFISIRNKLVVNRSLWVFRDSKKNPSYMTDLSSGQKYIMEKGHVYFIPCHHEISQVLTEDTYFVSYQFNLDLVNGVDIFEGYGKCVDIECPELVSDARSIIEGEDEVLALSQLNRLLYNLAETLLKDSTRGRKRNTPENYSAYEPVIRYLQNSCSAKTTVGQLADICGMRQDVFSRCFTRDMKITPKAFITNIVIRKAMKMLLRKDQKIRAVAEELEFSSEYFFYRFFKKHTAMTPGHFRELSIGANSEKPDSQS